MISPEIYVFVPLMIVYMLAVILSITTYCHYQRVRRSRLNATDSQDSGVDMDVNNRIV